MKQPTYQKIKLFGFCIFLSLLPVLSNYPAVSATPKQIKCNPKINCPVGSIGPGGGVVFYVSSKEQPWGRFIEVAQDGWNKSGKDPKSIWCDSKNVINPDLTVDVPEDSKEIKFVDPHHSQWEGTYIGQGLQNTNKMLGLCKKGAANLARDYRGGGKSDWVLMSVNDAMALCRFIFGDSTSNFEESNPRCNPGNKQQPPKGLKLITLGSTLWTSNEFDYEYAQQVIFNTSPKGMLNTGGWPKNQLSSVRPIRYFK